MLVMFKVVAGQKAAASVRGNVIPEVGSDDAASEGRQHPASNIQHPVKAAMFPVAILGAVLVCCLLQVSSIALT